MKTSTLLITTLREAPADAEIISHKLLLRAGMIRRLAAGIYTWLPLGLRVLRKIEAIVRDEMEQAGAQELLMPAIQPAKLWQESGRWDKYGTELLRIVDRHQQPFCIGPTHEEIITDIARNEINSYKQLPINFYQIQTKFRDEIRPRFGVMRAREFIMKDAYSFHLNDACLQETYAQMYTSYCNIFKRIGLKFKSVMADSGNIGGNKSHEFHVLANSGEDQIAFSEHSDYAANLEQAVALKSTLNLATPSKDMATVATPRQHSIEQVRQFLQVDAAQCLKTLIVQSDHDGLIALVLRGDHELNKTKAEKLNGIKNPLTLADHAEIKAAIGCDVGSIGPVNIPIPLFVDHAAAQVADFVCGANETDQHLVGVNWGRDLPVPESVDIRNVCAGEMAADNSGELCIARGIEVGHIFQLGTQYSDKMQAHCLNEKGQTVPFSMGCYGIGISRIVAAAIEQNHDQQGIIWPRQIAPFELALIPINLHKSSRLRDATLALYQALLAAKIDVLLEDRKERPGVMFADMELIGIPHRFVLSERGLDAGTIEYKGRTDQAEQSIQIADAAPFIKKHLA